MYKITADECLQILRFACLKIFIIFNYLNANFDYDESVDDDDDDDDDDNDFIDKLKLNKLNFLVQ